MELFELHFLETTITIQILCYFVGSICNPNVDPQEEYHIMEKLGTGLVHHLSVLIEIS